MNPYSKFSEIRLKPLVLMLDVMEKYSLQWLFWGRLIALKLCPLFKLSGQTQKISELLPHFSSLWEKRHVLEPEDNQQKKDACSDFPDYKICTVEDFLNQFTNGRLNFGDELPSSIREGIVNASHMVNLTRRQNGFSLDSLKFKPRDLPLADSRIKDYSINVIDATLLKAGLIRQCGFFFTCQLLWPWFYYSGLFEERSAYLHRSPGKRSNANTDDDVYKMQKSVPLCQLR